jgi:hypothetical protein
MLQAPAGHEQPPCPLPLSTLWSQMQWHQQEYTRLRKLLENSPYQWQLPPQLPEHLPQQQLPGPVEHSWPPMPHHHGPDDGPCGTGSQPRWQAQQQYMHESPLD